jgi:hypothetical protein
MTEQNPDTVRKIGVRWTRINMALAMVCALGAMYAVVVAPSLCVPFLLGVVGYSVLAMVYGNRAK